ncbi:SEC-C metal-binding domain-containing protein [Planctomycetota bacterium]
MKRRKIGRNDPCPCGSGLNFLTHVLTLRERKIFMLYYPRYNFC